MTGYPVKPEKRSWLAFRPASGTPQLAQYCRVSISDELKSLDGERTLVALRNALFCDILGGIEVGRFDIETDAIGSHAGEYVINPVAHDPGSLC